MADDSKPPRAPKISPTEAAPDPADAFARANNAPGAKRPEGGSPPLTPDEVTPGERPKATGAGKKKAPRSPTVDKPADADDEPMDPMDAAEEIVVLLDGLFTIASAIRGYDRLAVEGKPLVDMVRPDDAARARVKKALARLMKSAGANMSPGAAVAFSVLTCYGAPIATLEFARASAKKAGA